MNHRLARAIELIEAEAWAQLQLAAPREWQLRYGVRVSRRDRSTVLIASGTSTLALNRVIGLGCDSTLTETTLDEVIHEYATAGVTQFVIQWSPAAQPAEAMRWFSQRGGRAVSTTAKLYRTAQTEPAAGRLDIAIEEIEPHQAGTFEQVVAGPLGVPDGLGAGIRSTIGRSGWHYYLAFDDQRPIAGAACYMDGRNAWFGLAATLVTDRCRGAQTALLARRLADAAAAGCEWVSADTSSTGPGPGPSMRNMCRAGFTLVYDRPNILFSLVKGRRSLPDVPTHR